MTQEVREIYTAVWQIHKKYFDVRSDADWEMFLEECRGIYRKYDCQFARDLVQAMISEIEERGKCV